jgi:hypothetical protein
MALRLWQLDIEGEDFPDAGVAREERDSENDKDEKIQSLHYGSPQPKIRQY